MPQPRPGCLWQVFARTWAVPPSLTLHDLKADPGRMSLAGVLTQIGRLQRVRQVALPHDLFADVAPSVVQG